MKNKKTWRQVAAPIIADVLHNTKGMDERTIKTALYDAYPFGERAYHPYKVWTDEIRRQRGIKRKKTDAQLQCLYEQLSLFYQYES